MSERIQSKPSYALERARHKEDGEQEIMQEAPETLEGKTNDMRSRLRVESSRRLRSAEPPAHTLQQELIVSADASDDLERAQRPEDDEDARGNQCKQSEQRAIRAREGKLVLVTLISGREDDLLLALLGRRAADEHGVATAGAAAAAAAALRLLGLERVALGLGPAALGVGAAGLVGRNLSVRGCRRLLSTHGRGRGHACHQTQRSNKRCEWGPTHCAGALVQCSLRCASHPERRDLQPAKPSLAPTESSAARVRRGHEGGRGPKRQGHDGNTCHGASCSRPAHHRSLTPD
mmetsp:Transcript_111097/g.279343  ORF Transcript_111097/g.279343 Transcript_111097/m.279343 type:complete len:291 (+) Transcript_111097:29-901(+)